jgi:signal peptidase
LASILAMVGCLVFNVRPTVVISGSMSPGIPVGAVTLHRPTPVAQLRVGDVVTVPRPDDSHLVTHRITAIEKRDFGATLTLKGDANREADPVGYDVFEAGKVVAVLPLAGYFVLAVQDHPLAVIALLLVLSAVALYPAKDGREANPQGPATPANGA